MKTADYGIKTNTVAAFVSTNSIGQGQQVPILWPLIIKTGHEIAFAHNSFKWANLASHNAGVTVVIVCISNHASKVRQLFSIVDDGGNLVKEFENINAYLAPNQDLIVQRVSKPLSAVTEMPKGNMPYDNGHLLLSYEEAENLINRHPASLPFIRKIVGSACTPSASVGQNDVIA